MRRAVLLLHTINADARHFDWLLERDEGADPDERALISFRCEVRPDGAPAAFECERISNHRRLYLEFEGALSGGRGEVERVASGRLLELEFDASTLLALIEWESGIVRYRGALDGAGVWRFNATRAGGR